MQAFEDSRRLTGPNFFFAGCGAVLETRPDFVLDTARESAWRARIAAAFERLGWRGAAISRRHAKGASLALEAPPDQLYTATSVNEWAWQASCALAWQPDESADGTQPDPIASDEAALRHLAALAAAEADPARIALIDEAAQRGLPALWDDKTLSLGAGAHAIGWPLTALAAPADVPWQRLAAVPTALVTGTNGKTTTVRLLAAIAREAGLHAGHSCTDGLYLDGERIESGDYSGPAGARATLRHPRVEAAILETARGGILRRGLALTRASAAIVTNVSEDHFGEYGIDDLEALAATKLVVARAIGADGLLVLPADDPVLAAAADRLACPLGWFAASNDHPRLAAHRAAGKPTCGVDGGRMRLADPARGIDADLGAVAAMPLSVGGRARYNVANLLGAALTAHALGFAPAAIEAVFARFGASRGDNPGRLQRWTIGGIRVFVDYAHNPEGLAGLLEVAAGSPDPAQRRGRLILVLGQAGNRHDAEIAELAAAAAHYAPDLVVLKEIAGMLRGRAAGDVPAVLREALGAHGVPPERIQGPWPEVEAARHALAEARAGDLLVLPIHMPEAVAQALELLDRLEQGAWRPGDPF